MKMQGPPGVCSPISHGGAPLHLDDDNCVEVSGHMAETLASHGFMPVADLPPDAPARRRGRPPKAVIQEEKPVLVESTADASDAVSAQ